MKEIQKLDALYKDGNSIDIGALAGVFESSSKNIGGYKVSFIAFISKKSPIDMFNEWNDEDFSFSLKKYFDFHVIDLSRNIKRSDIEGGQRIVKGSFGIFQYNKSDIWIGFTSESPDFFNNGVVRFIESYRPSISRIYLSSEEIRSLFESIEENLSCEIFIKKAVLYSHVKEGQIRFEKEHFQEVFNKADNDSYYVDKIEHYFKIDEKIIYHGFISRSAISYYYSGNISYFFNLLLPLIANNGIKKSELFEDRERSFGKIEIKPIDIIYSQDVFKIRHDNILLIRALEKVSRGALAVYHKNPYLHVSFLDFIDGSNFDIFVTASNKLTIIPNFKCSMHSLMRVCEQISKNFKEGSIELAEAPNFTLADFIGD